MKRALRLVALLLALGVAALWVATGANRGWTKTRVQVRTLDEVTGIDGISYEAQFRPGVDFLAVGLLGALGLAGVSFIFRNKTKTESKA